MSNLIWREEEHMCTEFASIIMIIIIKMFVSGARSVVTHSHLRSLASFPCSSTVNLLWPSVRDAGN